MVDARLHPADIIAHDEEDVWFLLLLRLCGAGPSRLLRQLMPQIDASQKFRLMLKFLRDKTVVSKQATFERWATCARLDQSPTFQVFGCLNTVATSGTLLRLCPLGQYRRPKRLS